MMVQNRQRSRKVYIRLGQLVVQVVSLHHYAVELDWACMQGMHYFESFGCIFFSQFKFLFLQVYCAQVCIRGDPCGLPSLEPGFQQVPHLGTVKRFFDLVVVLELLKFICL